MNGSNGDSHGASSGDLDLPQILAALQAIYEPQSSNEQRHNATTFLEQVKSNSAAPSHGFNLAQDTSQTPIARHYGLSLLEHAIRYKLDDFTGEECDTIRGWVIQLAQNISENDPPFLRGKVARLWVDLAERNWGLDWMDMDESLCKIWQGSYVHHELVLYVLETLADEVFNVDNTGAASLRSNELGKACVEIYTAENVLSRVFPERESSTSLRHGSEGWFHRLLEMLERCLCQDLEQQQQAQTRMCISKILAVVQAIVPWIILKAVHDSECLSLISRCLTTQDSAIQMGAIEVLHALYHRAPWPEEGILILACPVLSTDGLAVLRQFYDSACCESDDIDSDKYTMLKKFTEMFCALVTFWETRPRLIAENCDTTGIASLLVTVMQDPSLAVSIPIAFVWTRLLSVAEVVNSAGVTEVIGPLLEICSRRLLRYENLPTESQDETMAFLNEDFDTVPERHAFLGNYRRFCMTVIDKIVRKAPFEAMRHILSQADEAMQNLYAGQPEFRPETFTVNSAPILRLDAQSTVVMTALKSYQKWMISQKNRGKHHAEESSAFEAAVMQWSKALLEKDFPDPIIRKRMFQLIVEIAILGFSGATDLCLTLTTAVFTMPQPTVSHRHPTYDEAVKDLQASYPRELQKLAPHFCDDLFLGYNGLHAGVIKKATEPSLEERVRLDYQAFLFVIVQRTSRLSSQNRLPKLDEMLQPVVQAWQDPKIHESLQSFESFCKQLHLDLFPRVFLDHNAAASRRDWSLVPLKPREIEIRNVISDNIQLLPLQGTRSLLSVSTERLRPGSSAHRAAQALWKDVIPIILPKILGALSCSHAFANPDTWSKYPPEMRTIIGRILVDRVWQSGISNESKDDFYTKVRNSKASLEGLASAVRSAIRGVREVGYWILHCMSMLGDVFYCHQDLAHTLAGALFNNARFLSPNQLMSLLKLSTALIEGCPAQYRHNFLPPLLIALMRELIVKLTNEWEATTTRTETSANDDALDQEMKAESILRHLTHSCVTLVSNMVVKRSESAAPVKHENGNGSNGTNGQDVDVAAGGDSAALRSLVINDEAVLESLVVFCNHALRMRDSRCCSIITRVLRSLIPEFAEYVDVPRLSHHCTHR